MNARSQTIAEIFAAWLKRYSPPRIMADAPDVQKQERDTLLRVLLRFAPTEQFEPWLNQVLDRLEYQMKTRAWPTKGEIGAVCSNLAKDQFRASSVKSRDLQWEPDPVALAARKMNDGEPIGDEWIYGRRCVELMASGAALETTLRKYRSAWFFAHKSVYGQEKALAAEAAMKAKHTAAEAAFADPGPRYQQNMGDRLSSFGHASAEANQPEDAA